MNIQLIHGEFDSKEALEIITKMLNVKIKFHENKISKDCSEENIKSREAKIKRLQNEQYEIRKFIESHDESVKLNSTIEIS